jgi:lipoprotein NlpI
MRFFPVLVAALVVVATAQTRGQNPEDVFARAVADFESGRVVESANGFDNLIKLVPNSAPQLWQRGIALYYAGRYKDCRAQFESHRTVNPDDVENAAWHFLCVARQESPDKAKSALLPVGPDARTPMREIYDMFRGARRPEEVLAAAGQDALGQFYAQLYVGLYFEALGNKPKALEHITAAAADRFARPGLYMHTVAKVHLGILQRGKD